MNVWQGGTSQGIMKVYVVWWTGRVITNSSLGLKVVLGVDKAEVVVAEVDG